MKSTIRSGVLKVIWTSKSMAYVAEKAPNVDAYLANGISHYRRNCDGLEQRFVSLEVKLEEVPGNPLITRDNALYWRIFKSLGIAPVIEQGRLLYSLPEASG